MDLSTGIMLINYGHKSVMSCYMFLLNTENRIYSIMYNIYQWLKIELKWVVVNTGLVESRIQPVLSICHTSDSNECYLLTRH